MAWYNRWRNVFRSEQPNYELDNEFAHHLAETADRLRAEGLPQHEAIRIAKLRLGNYSVQKENTRDMNIASWLDQTRADLLYGLRQLKLSPAFTIVAVLSLGLGIGANTSIFQLVNAIRIKTLPVKDPQQLVVVKYMRPSHRSGSGSSRSAEFTYVQWQQLQAEHEPFSGVLAFSATRFNLTTGGEPRFAEGLYVSGNFFEVLGVSPIIGRTLSAQDDTTSCTAGAVISYAFWQREFAGDPAALGRKLSLDGYSVPVIGVTPPGFFGVEVGSRYDVAVPLCTDRLIAEGGPGRIPQRIAWWLSIMGRLKPGWTINRASAYLRAISPQIMRDTLPSEYNSDFAKLFLTNKLDAEEARSGVSDLRREYERPLYLLLAISALVLLIACANLANLLLARATARESEIAVRLAMGASRSRVARQFLSESLLLAVFGTLLGASLAIGLSRALVALISSSQNPIYIDVAVDWRVLGFAAGLAILTCLLFGLLPALRATHLSPAVVMRAAGRTATTGRERLSLRRALVVTQVALSLVLLVGAFLFVRTFRNLLTTDPGFDAQGILAVSVDFGKAPIAKERRQRVYRELIEKFSAIPGVLSAAQVGATPISDNSWDENIGIGGPAAGSHKQAWFNRISPGYFRTMGTRLIAGRDFNDHDSLSSTKVAVINEEFARKFFPGINPLGHTFSIEAEAGKREPVFQIVGVVQNTKYLDLREDFRPIGLFPIAQNDDAGAGGNFVLRIAGSPSSVTRSAKAVVAAISPAIGIEFRALSAQLADSVLRERLMATLSAAFGFLAALLATLGLYGVMAYMVARRRKEIGIRMALGSRRNDLIRLILREAVLLLAIGLSVGVAISLWVGQLAEALLYGVKPRDIVSLTGACALLGAIALLASYLPARRAAGGDPTAILRAE
jgi:predicted permease